MKKHRPKTRPELDARERELVESYKGTPLVRVEEDAEGQRVIAVGVEAPEHLLAAANIDLDRWRIATSELKLPKINWWGQKAKGEPPVILRQANVWLEPKFFDDDWVAGVREIVSKLGKVKPRAVNTDGDVMVELALFDPHFGQRNMGSLEQQAERISTTVRTLYTRAAAALPSKPSRVLLVLGGDVAHCDSIRGETTAGTSLEDALPYPATYSALVGLVLAEIRWLLKQGVEVTALVVGGNHDYHLSLHLGELLRVAFAEQERVEVVSGPEKFVRYRWGTCLLGFAHGDTSRPTDYAGLMAAEWPQDWGETTHREWHTGHQHRTAQLDRNGCRFRIVPTLCSRNSWAVNQGHAPHHRGAEAYLWSQSRGYLGHLAETLEDG